MRVVVFFLIGVVVLLAAGPIRADDPSPKSDSMPEPFTLERWSVDSGGGLAAGGSLELQGTIGQPDAGSAAGGAYVLQGGFLPGGDQGLLFADGFESGATERWDTTVGNQ